MNSSSFMKYISLFLLILVSIFGLQQMQTQNQTFTTASTQLKELPIYSVDTQKKVVALTFDSAWGTEDLPEILSILEKHHAPSTFFVTGQWANDNPDAIKAIDAAGHEIANHGNKHKHMSQLTNEEMIKEMKDCHDTIYTLIGKDMTLFRAPYSDWNEDVVSVAHSLGYMSINQSVDSLDWKDYGIDSIIQTVCEHKNLENGSIILLHNGATYTKDALDQLLTSLESKGYSFILVSDLIYTKDYYLDHTGKQFLKS